MIEKKELENGLYQVKVTMPAFTPAEERLDMPYPPMFEKTEWEATLSHNEDKTPAAEVCYKKRPGGVYIYSNNPEMMFDPDVNQMLLKNEHLTGECFFTYEHSNHSAGPIFLGYKLYNDGDKPVTVTVTNIGNQVRGEWLGQREWCDFYGLEFDLPEDYFFIKDGKKVLNPMYVGCDYVEYKTHPFTPHVVTIAPGEYYWVLGGTTGDLDTGSWSGVTADQAVLVGRCANGAVRFIIEGGELHGSFWCYDDPKQCDITKPEQGYIIKRDDRNFAAQYKGIDENTKGLLEAEISFMISDETKPGKLPVKYQVTRDPNHADVKEAFAKLNMQTFDLERNDWLVALNPNDNHTAVGTDMIVFKNVLPDGTPILIDNEHTDGECLKANTGNWMVQYTTNYNLMNVGDRARRVKIYGRNTGVLMVIVRNEKGEILEKKLNMQPYSFPSKEEAFKGVDTSLLIEKNGRWWFGVDGKPYCDVWDERSLEWELELPANTAIRLSVDDLILANSCGGIQHWVEVD